MKKLIIINAKNITLGKLIKFLLTFISINYKYKIITYNYYIVIMNINFINFNKIKLKKKLYFNHSGYPGGLKIRNLKTFIKKNFFKLMIKIIKNSGWKTKLFIKIIKNNIKFYKNLSNKYNKIKPKIINEKLIH